MSKPIPPADDDCCGGGACNPCVWDNYYEELRLWREEQQSGTAQEDATKSNVRIRINLQDDPKYR